MNDKTEPPSQKKLRDARKKGQVVKSKEISSAAQLTVALAMLFAFMPHYVSEVQRMILLPSAFYEAEFGFAANAVMEDVTQIAFSIFAPIVIVVAVVGAVANLAQFGLLFSTESLKPKLSNLSPASGIKKIIALKNLIEFLKSTIKIVFLSLLIYLVIRDLVHEVVKIPHCGVQCIPSILGAIFIRIMIYTIAAFVIIAAADYLFQRMQFMKEQKMTKDEVKREYKESEGDPHIKGKRKQMAQEIAMSDTEEKVKNSKVVVTNPIHLAIALDYRKGETPLPIIRAMGADLQAKRIVQLAEKHGVPIMQNVPLAHGLFDTGDVGQYIPTDLMKEVAEVLRWVMQFEAERQRNEGGH
ncbi:MAG: type III secretion system export apparatus subunit SctU [Pseudomonadota bacterium]